MGKGEDYREPAQRVGHCHDAQAGSEVPSGRILAAGTPWAGRAGAPGVRHRQLYRRVQSDSGFGRCRRSPPALPRACEEGMSGTNGHQTHLSPLPRVDPRSPGSIPNTLSPFRGDPRCLSLRSMLPQSLRTPLLGDHRMAALTGSRGGGRAWPGSTPYWWVGHCSPPAGPLQQVARTGGGVYLPWRGSGGTHWPQGGCGGRVTCPGGAGGGCGGGC